MFWKQKSFVRCQACVYSFLQMIQGAYSDCAPSKSAVAELPKASGMNLGHSGFGRSHSNFLLTLGCFLERFADENRGKSFSD